VSAVQPRTVSLSSALWLAAAACGVTAALIMLLDLDGLEAAVRAVVERDFPHEQAVTRDRAVAATSAVLVAGGAAGLAQAGAALRMRAGHGGARFLLVLLLVVTVVEIVLAVGVVDVVARIALLLAVAFAVVGAVVMYLPPSNRWFATRRV
jgi:hypothetical protein